MKYLFCLLALLCSLAQATTNYVCKCDTGADASCVAGSDAAAGTSSETAWQNMSKVQTIFNSALTAGDQVLLCKGGSWTSTTGLTIGAATQNTTKANPFTFGAYTPHWGGAGAKPKVTFATASGNGAGLYLTGSGVVAFAGLVVSGQNWIGPNDSTMSGLYSGYYWTYITLDNMTLDSFQFGVTTVAGQTRNLTVKNSTIKNNRNSGVLINISNVLFENNTFDNNGSCEGGPGDGSGCQGATLRHTFYVASGIGFPVYNIVFRHNTITKNSYLGGTCGGSVITGHGLIYGYLIEKNYINMASANVACYGIGYGPNSYVAGMETEGVRDWVVRGNTIVNVGDGYIICGACLRGVIENNVLINTTGLAFQQTMMGFGAAPDSNPAHHLQTDKVTIRNNSIYQSGSTDGDGKVIAVEDSTGGGGGGTGTGAVVVNNLIYMASGAMDCWNTGTKSASDFAEFDYNLCYNLGTGSNTPPSGLNTHGLTSNPNLRTLPPVSSAWDMQIQTSSPAKNAGTPSGRGARRAIKGYPAIGTRDIGAYEYGSNP